MTYSGEEAGTISNGTQSISFSEIEEISGSESGDTFDLAARTDNNSYVVAAGAMTPSQGARGQMTCAVAAVMIRFMAVPVVATWREGRGNDTVIGGDGEEDIYGNSGDDVSGCGAGDDWISGRIRG